LLLSSELFLEFPFQLKFFLVELSVQVGKTFIDVFKLLLFESGELVSCLIEQFAVLLVQAASIQNHFLQVKHILLQTCCHVFNLDQLVPVMFVKDTPSAYRVGASFTKVLYFLLQMSGTASEHSATWTFIIAHKLGLSVFLGRDLHNLYQLLIFEKLF
jgi:hypothetical protein